MSYNYCVIRMTSTKCEKCETVLENTQKHTN